MSIIGNPKSKKFYIVKSDRSIEWVPSLNIAKKAVEDKDNKEWYGKDIYCTNEEIVKGIDNKLYIKSDMPILSPIEYTFPQMYNDLKEQANKYLLSRCELFLNRIGFKSFEEGISWKDSSIESLKANAQKCLEIRDTYYNYHINFFINNPLKKIKSEKVLQGLYKKYLEGFPKKI